MATHNELGQQGEALAREHLAAKGYTIVAQNFRAGKAEVDIIARTGNLFVFAEVKTRTNENYGVPESFVSNKKQKLFAKAAEDFCDINNYRDIEIRYDILSVIINQYEQRVHHIEDAFFPDNLGLKQY